MYSFFNGLAPKNVFFHAVACQSVQLELQRLEFEVSCGLMWWHWLWSWLKGSLHGCDCLSGTQAAGVYEPKGPRNNSSPHLQRQICCRWRMHCKVKARHCAVHTVLRLSPLRQRKGVTDFRELSHWTVQSTFDGHPRCEAALPPCVLLKTPGMRSSRVPCFVLVIWCIEPEG